MPNYRRARVEGGTYFFTVNTFRRQSFLTDADVRAALCGGMATVRAEHPSAVWERGTRHLLGVLHTPYGKSATKSCRG